LTCGTTNFPCQPDAVEGDDCNLCLVDDIGVARCNGLTECRVIGETCSTALDCCDLVACVPDQDGILRCGADWCVETGGPCTSDADCCPPNRCIREVGSVQGTCGTDTPPPPTGGAGGQPATGGAPPTGGVSGGGVPGGGAPPTGGVPTTGGTVTTCALYGQLCDNDADCCNDVPCTNGRCINPPG
jgi:hypothetical protein